MDKCFLTQIDNVIDNPNAEYLGGLVFSFIPNSGGTNNTLVGMASSPNNTYKILGDGNFTDDSGNSLGKEVTTHLGFLVSDNVRKVLCTNKYNITQYRADEAGSRLAVGVLKITDFSYSKLNQLVVKDISGDVSKLPSTITRLELGKGGTLKSFHGDLTHILEDTSTHANGLFVVYGDEYLNTKFDISKMSIEKQNTIASIDVENVDFKGEITNLNLKNLFTFNAYSSVVRGDLKCLNNSRVGNVNLLTSEVTGDISKLPISCKEVALSSNSVVTYTTKNSARTEMLLVVWAKMDTQSIDRYLIDMAPLVKPTGTRNRIVIYGTRTNASDSAVNTLTSKGISVSVSTL